MARNLLACALGYMLWTSVFLGGSSLVRSSMAAVHDDAGFTRDGTALSLYLVISVVASLLAGWAAARFAHPPKTKWVVVTALALLATGIPVQLSTWESLPVWYNLVFLGLLVPATVFGGRLGGSAAEAPPSA